MLRTFDNLIEGKIKKQSAGRYVDALNPSTGEVFARIADASLSDVSTALSSARLAFDHGQWPRMSPSERSIYLYKIAEQIRTHAKELADLECAHVGKVIKSATFIDVPTAADTFEYFAKEAHALSGERLTLNDPSMSLLEREPMGVVGAIIPWNYPLIMAAWKLAPALIAGNAVVLKIPIWGSASILRLAEIIESVGLPKGVVNIIASTDANVSQHIVLSADVDMISFTGSTTTGKKVMSDASGTLKKLVLELGGKSPNIVFADCQMDAAVGGSLSAIFLNQGQMCTAGSRLFIEDKIYDKFIKCMIDRLKTLRIGPADSFETEFGPLVSVEHRDKVLSQINQAVAQGARIAFGGKIPTQANPKGAFLEPTVLVDVRNEMKISQEEVFGPVLCVMPFSSVNQVVQMANDSIYGLAAMIWTTDLAKANMLARQLRCGTVWINTYGKFLNETPFGGFKQSGFGRELGRDGLFEYTQLKNILTDQTPGGKPLVASWF